MAVSSENDALRGPPAMRATLDYYDRNAEWFWEGTRDHDVSQNIAAMLEAIEGEPPYAILDLGCGPGRDLAQLTALGHEAVGLDGSSRFAEMARRHSGCEVWVQDFTSLDLPAGRFDAVFANASLFHIPSRDLPEALARLHAALKPRGVLFSSNPRGNDEEGFSGGRYACFWRDETWCRIVAEAGFIEVTRYWRPAGKPRDQQPWFATVWRRA